jgi:hypothetical protein
MKRCIRKTEHGQWIQKIPFTRLGSYMSDLRKIQYYTWYFERCSISAGCTAGIHKKKSSQASNKSTELFNAVLWLQYIQEKSKYKMYFTKHVNNKFGFK